PGRHEELSLSAFTTDRLIEWISRQDGPWFVHASYMRPHPPYAAAGRWSRRYDPADVPMPLPIPDDVHPMHQRALSFSRAAAPADEAGVRELRAQYYGMVSEVDDQVGRLIDRLREWGLYDDTLIIVTSDHGEMLGDHWMLGKQGYCDEAFHVPLIVRDPLADDDAGRGRRIDRFTEAIDLMPTILESLGLAVPRQCDGRSLLALARGHDVADWRTEVHWAFDFRGAGPADAETALGLRMDACSLAVIRDSAYKYVHFAGLPPLFFDLAADPYCLDDLSPVPSAKPAMLVYAQKMLTWRMLSSARDFTGMTTSPGGLVVRG
ncbi:MAG TPA: sulfatase-like hydrolase/transferase, partial [Vineibacter sp.]|nr:sulfatase-like hydrolase/transferase [Vineibacter sp.]